MADDPRSEDEYVTADPRDIVEEDGTAMGGPGGTPQEGLSVEERRELSRELGRDPRARGDDGGD